MISPQTGRIPALGGLAAPGGRLAGVLMLAAALAACPGPKTKTTPPNGTKDDPPNVAPSEIIVTGDYQMVWPGLNYGPNGGYMKHVIAARDISFVNSLAVGNLDVITTFAAEKTDGKGGDESVKSLYSMGDAVVDSVAVSTSVPERVLFIAEPPNGVVIGRLYSADLSQWPPAPKQVTGINGPATNVPVGGYFFGSAGNQVLFIEQMPPTGGAGVLDWTDGSKTTKIGDGSFPRTIIVSADQTKAVALVNVGWLAGTPGIGKGDLVAINMSTGKSVVVAPGIAGVANTYAQTGCPSATNPDCALSSAYDRAYSMSGDGRIIAYAKDGVVNVASINYAGETPVVTQKSLGSGRFPGVSLSGRRVAFYDDARALQVVDISNISAPTTITTIATSGFLSPRFSPDDAYVAYLEKLSVKGNDPRYGGDLGTVKLMPVTAGATAVTYAEHALWHSLSFWPNDPTRATVQLSVMSNVHDPLNPQVFTAERAVGDLLVDGPGALPSAGRTRSSAPVATSVAPTNFALLPASGGFGILTATSPTTMGTPNADVWLPASPVVRPGNTQHVQQFVLAGSLQTSASVPGLSSVDEVILSVSNRSYETLYDDRLVRGDLWGSAAGTASLLKSDVFFQTLSTDGRVLAIHPQNDSPDSKVTEVWSLPLQGGR